MGQHKLVCPKQCPDQDFYGYAVVNKEYLYDSDGLVIESSGEEDYVEEPDEYYCANCSSKAIWVLKTLAVPSDQLALPLTTDLPLNSPFEVELD